jgi:hypothetical protein
MSQPNPSPRSPAATITVSYENDVKAGAEALLAVLRRDSRLRADTASDSDHESRPDNEATAEQSTAA